MKTVSDTKQSPPRMTRSTAWSSSSMPSLTMSWMRMWERKSRRSEMKRTEDVNQNIQGVSKKLGHLLRAHFEACNEQNRFLRLRFPFFGRPVQLSFQCYFKIWILDLFPLIIVTQIDIICDLTREKTSRVFHSKVIGDLVRPEKWTLLTKYVPPFRSTG